MLGVQLDRAGRVKVNADLSIPGHPEVFAIGDMALVLEADGTPVPGFPRRRCKWAPTSRGSSRMRLRFRAAEGGPRFKYWDKGTMATIGRSAAVAQVGRFEFSGVTAWLAWLVIHLIFLVGFRNKISVLFQWLYSYITYKRGARIIADAGEPPPRGK